MRFLCSSAVAMLLAAHAAGAWELVEKFNQYAAGSDASPVWETTGMFWETRDGQFIGADHAHTFAFPAAAPAGRRVVIETTISVVPGKGDEWKIAGVAVMQSPKNFWHLALIESPDRDGRHHAIELAESLDGQWLAHAADGTRLSAIDFRGSSFNWQSDHPYRLRLEVTPDNIRGTVTELDGTERAALAYRFDNHAVTFGRPALDTAGFQTKFRDITSRVTEPVTIPPAESPKFLPCDVRGNPAHRLRPTGFFHVAERGGRNWFVTPGGEEFFVIGTDHVSYHAHWCEQLGYAPYARNVARQYGSETNWSTEALRRLNAWGFNSLSAGHSESLRYRGLPHIEFLGLGTGFAALASIVPPENWTGFPNVFHPKFAAFCDKQAREKCAKHRDDQWVIGYFIDNELQWFGKSWNTTLHASALQLPADDPARKIAETTTADEFTRLVAEKYFSVTAAAIRKADPNHLVLGCRFAGAAPSNVYAVAGKYCDVVTINIYPRVDLETGEVHDSEKLLREVHEKSGRPVMVTEWGFPALDAVDSTGKPLPCQHGAGMRVDTQDQKARCCESLQRLLFRLPFVIGSDFFMWADEPALGISHSFPEDSNYGLVSETDKPYDTLVNTFTALNPRVYGFHSGTDTTPLARLRNNLAIAAAPTGTVNVSQADGRVCIDNGALRLTHEKNSGNAWDKIELNGVTLGRFTPNIHRGEPNVAWLAAQRTTDVAVTNFLGRTVVEMTFEYENVYRTAYRFTISPQQNWFTAQFLWLENIAPIPWLFAHYYHYLPSFIGGSVAGDTLAAPAVPDYYLPFAAWQDTVAGKQFGALALHDGDFHISFWTDENKGQHPDADHAVDRQLAPGERYAVPQPSIIIFGAPAGTRPTDLVQRLRALATR